MDTRKLLHYARASAQVTKQANLNHSQLAIATLGVTIGGAVLATSGKKAEAPTSPPINAKSSDEESFVKYVDAILHLPR
jgi:F-type H+-transporting ATPase subunit k